MTRQYPMDWPANGPIDLAVHDLPHRSATTEWWYLNAHLESPTGNGYGIFAAFFRIVVDIDPTTEAPVYAYSLTWAVSDLLQAERYWNTGEWGQAVPAPPRTQEVCELKTSRMVQAQRPSSQPMRSKEAM